MLLEMEIASGGVEKVQQSAATGISAPWRLVCIAQVYRKLMSICQTGNQAVECLKVGDFPV